VIIRNSISEIEQQLAGIPYFMRTHRAFIVNLGKVISKNGNSLGYQLKLKGSNHIIPVSRQNTQIFDELTRKFLLSIHH
jgi:DNA-binding LytR/AlgR family response regulator